jgi:aryl carrier-like protein
VLDELPKNAANKVDRRALPEPSVQTAEPGSAVKPTNREEELLVNVFKDILSVTHVGVNDSFFALGGDSIKAIRIVSLIRERGYAVTVQDIMELRTIAAIAAILRPAEGSSGNGNNSSGSGSGSGNGNSGGSGSYGGSDGCSGSGNGNGNNSSGSGSGNNSSGGGGGGSGGVLDGDSAGSSDEDEGKGEDEDEDEEEDFGLDEKELEALNKLL